VKQGRCEAVLARGPEAIQQAVSVMTAAGGRPILQQPVSGVMHCASAFRAPDGTVSGHVHQTSSHLWPLPLGTTARAVTTPLDAALAGQVERLLQGLQWVGMVCLQMFRQPDGSDVLIDVNGRFNHSLALSQAAGVHYARAWAEVGAGETSVTLPDGRPGVAFSYLLGDTRRALRERRGGLVRDLASTWWFALGARHTLLSLSDPGPAGRYVANALLAQLRSRARSG
jgi:hypothetical protein